MKQKTYEVYITMQEIYTIKADNEYDAINLVKQSFGDLQRLEFIK